MAKSLVIFDFSVVVLMIVISRFVPKYGLIIPFQTVNPFLFQQVDKARMRKAWAGNVLWGAVRICEVQNRTWKLFFVFRQFYFSPYEEDIGYAGFANSNDPPDPNTFFREEKVKRWFKIEEFHLKESQVM